MSDLPFEPQQMNNNSQNDNYKEPHNLTHSGMLNTSMMQPPQQYGLFFNQNLIQESNHKPTLISQGLFTFDEKGEERHNNLEIFNSFQFNYQEHADNLYDYQEEFEGDEDLDEEYEEEDEDNQQNYQSKENPNEINTNPQLDDKQFACEYEECRKTFKAKKSLRDHMRIHTNERPYSCSEPHCGKSFVQYSSLQKHSRTHKGDRPYKCDFLECDQAFTQVSNLKRHQKVHLNDKSFQCLYCPRKFTTSSNLKQHTITHESQGLRQRFQCAIDDCGKSYLYSSSLKKHEKDHILSAQPKLDPPQNIPIKILNDQCDIHGSNRTKIEKFSSTAQLNQIPEEEENIINEFEEEQDKLIVPNEAELFDGKPFSPSQTILTTSKQQTKETDQCLNSSQNINKNKQIQGSRVNTEDMDMLCQFFNSHHVALQHDGHYDVLFKGYLYHYNRKSGKIEIHDIQAHDEITKGTCQPLSELSHNSYEEINKKLIEDENSIQNQAGSSERIPKNINQEPEQNMLDLNPQIKCNSNCIAKCCNNDSSCIKQVLSKQDSENQSNYQQNTIKYEDCCCTYDTIKQECTCIGCEGDCPTCSKSTRCIFKRTDSHSSQQQNQHSPQIERKEQIYHSNYDPQISENQQSSFQEQLLNLQQYDNQKCICPEIKDAKHMHGPNCGHIPIYHHGHLDYIVENKLHHPHGTHCDFHGTVSVLDNIVKL